MTSSVSVVDTRTAQGSRPRAVLLDLDGTLVDTEGIWWAAEAEVFADLGHVLDEVHRDVVVGGPMARSVGHLMEVTGTTATLAELTVAINTRFEELIVRGAPLMPGARRLLTELSAYGVPTALVSASHRRTIDAMLRSLGPEHFDFTLAGDEVARTKPHPDPYLTAAARLGADPAQCVVIEDTLTGVTSAEAAGCLVVAVPSLVPIPPAAGRTVVSSLEELSVPFLRSLNTRIH
ncbi:haloacid dehalogenase superfamily, subfamily IA, variant 3 with third motif having DD or ED [Streptomyces sp. DvalAA-14]|uniref:HAD family hydrolase n=1 Tax=unclassified Streptomyces TaxID=2593676 RepID=UPI00081B1F74|nr:MULTISPECIES: HAD family phosphatase [unclassified Streptomyces]MYS20433.1 HAD-IA family hydrolase [Streptomyces sp. SID4948]SCD68758.1 haloacid dehalogenase superfamily, subfamily IA, variant 3 with third motif having DD or ED [Streptomyces sp. DvalAA-14]